MNNIKSIIAQYEELDGTGVIQDDPYLSPHEYTIKQRYQNWLNKLKQIEESEGFDNFTSSYKVYGFYRVEGGIMYRDWLPNAHAVHLIGDFNGWNYHSHALQKKEYGKWELFLPDNNGVPQIPNRSRVKIAVTHNGNVTTKVPAYIKYATQEKGNPVYDGVYIDESYERTVPRCPTPENLRIYECHIGMATQEYKIGSYNEFRENILPYIKDSGYNAIQMMAIMEHSYYASFGYQVTNFFAPSSRFGTPNELKMLIDTAHSLGIIVLLDLVHSHSSKNVNDGINMYDGTDSCFFHSIGSGRGLHDMWDSRLFNYSEWEVLRFLLSNVRYWIEEIGFDGFRFDGVSSMVYKHHGIYKIPMSYNEYYGDEADEEALTYLALANFLIHTLKPDAISVCEEVSGLVGLCRELKDGGYGFDYRLAMSLPDKWIALMKKPDETWNMGNICFTLTNRRWKEKNICYAESHDQALVGDKTLIFWLMDKEMYDKMSILTERTLIVDRGISLHKMIRLITFSLGGEGYLNFMGNEFGHPEWIDFPREGNGHSFHYCRRQWSLAHDPLLRYQHLKNFDKAMMLLDQQYPIFLTEQFVSNKHEDEKTIVFERGNTFNLVFAFNFHHSNSYTDYRIGVKLPGKYKIVLDSDTIEFGGHARNDPNTEFFTEEIPHCDRKYSLRIYLPSRVALVFALVDE